MTLQRFGPLGQSEDLSFITATIALDGSLSAAVDLAGLVPVRIDMPAAWTTAVITVQVSTDNSSFRNLFTATGTEYSVTTAASRAVLIAPVDGVAWQRYVKIRSGTAGAAVTQTAERKVTLVCRKI
jgi:cobalamin biosynthesis protein CbiG